MFDRVSNLMEKSLALLNVTIAYRFQEETAGKESGGRYPY